MTEEQNKLADELDAEVKNERSGKIANLMMRASAALREPATEAVLEKEFDTLHKQLTEVRATVDEIETVLDGRALKGRT